MTMIDKHIDFPQYSVGELSLVIKQIVEDRFSYVRVKGELSNFKKAPSGHVYMNLKDESAIISAVCWKNTADRFKFKPEDGLQVSCVGRVTTYPGQSKYQIIIEHMEPAGIGALMELLEQRKKKLAAEGLFNPERKKPIKFFPEIIGVITSPTGAVIKDILHRIEDRCGCHVLIWPVLVQGDQAAKQIANAIYGFNALQGKQRPDTLIVARGGGSIEDLWPFNEEIVVRAAAASDIPLISAVGHETDTTLIDYASDLRAPTPTAAAEKAVPVKADLLSLTEDLQRRLKKATIRLFDDRKKQLIGILRGLPKLSQLLDDKTQNLDHLILRMNSIFPRILKDKEQKLFFLSKLLESYHYKRVLERGFAVVYAKESVVSSAQNIDDGQKLSIEFADGKKEVIALGKLNNV